MAKRNVQIEIQIDGAKSISDLEKLCQEINKELVEVDRNSEAFLELSEASKKANAALIDVKKNLEVISHERQIDSISKIGGAMASSFAVATIAAGHLGKESAESIQKAIRTATELSTIVQSIKPIMEAVSSANLKAAGAFIKGFKESSVAATLFGTTTRAAITATGIGALVLLLGVLVANWEAVTEAVYKFTDALGLTNHAQEQFFKTQQEGIEKSREQYEVFSHAIERQIALLTAQGHKEEEIFELRKQQLNEQLKIVKAQLDLDNLRLAQANKQVEVAKIQENALHPFLRWWANITSQVEKATEQQTEVTKEVEKTTEQVLTLDNQLDVLNTNEKRRIWERENAEAQRLLNISDSTNKIAEADAEKEKARNQKMQDELLKQFKERKAEEVQFTIEAENSEEAITKTREGAILDYVSRMKLKKDQETKTKLRDEEIKYLEEIKNRTVEQEEVLSDLKFEKFSEYINSIKPFVTETLDGINQITAALTDAIQRQFEQLELQQEKVDIGYTTSIENRKALEAQLADAQGSQRDEILASIEQERQKEKQLADEKKRINSEKIKAQNRQQEIEWRNSILNSIVQGVLGSVEALPNIPLSILVGGLAAASTGIIVANKPEPITTGYYEGGFTKGLGFKDASGHEVAGTVHAGEYVADAKTLETPMGAMLANAFESIRLGKPSYDVGGFVGPPSIPIQAGISFSPEQMKAIIESANINVNVQEVSSKQTNVRVIESRASLKAA